MAECIVITHTTIFIVSIIWVSLSILMMYKYPFHIDQNFTWIDTIAVLFMICGLGILGIIICLSLAWFLFSYIPTILPCIKIVP
jgi:hypothetical protein